MRKGDDGYKIGAGRPRLKPWEQKATVTFRIQQETYQRIVRLAKREKRSMSAALELLVRTQESEKIEPTIPVNYANFLEPRGGYSVTTVLDQK